MLFGGLLVNTGNSTVWLRWIQWISPIKYGYSAMMKNQFEGYIVNGKPIGDEYLDEVQLGSFSIGVDIIFVLGISLLAWVLSYVALAYLTKKGRGDSAKYSTKKCQAELLGQPDARFAKVAEKKSHVATLAATEESQKPMLNLSLDHCRAAQWHLRRKWYTSASDKQPERGWRRQLLAFKQRPASHITAFAVLHELTAVVPLVGVYYALDYLQPQMPFPQSVLEEGNRYINKLRTYAGLEQLDADSPVLLHLATSYAVVKAAAPLRIAASLALTPWFSRWCIVPITRTVGKLWPNSMRGK
ncbi:hypothetical protein GGI13_002983 [Coemansia sp. RSA 455]|nr:hypothetical protein GGI13_002983 [Coemansia sp. RSA 455]